MYRNVKKMFLIFLFLLMSKPSYAIFAGKVVTMEHRWPENTLLDKVYFYQQITYDGGPDAIYFWGNQFQFQNGKSGYIGLFNRDTHTVHFSIWNATGWKSDKCKHFTHQGSGVRCEIAYPWKIGRQYQLGVSKNGNLVTGTITDVISGKQTTIGTIEVPNTFGQFHKSFGFVEDHSRWKRHLTSCYVLSPQSSTFSSPVGMKEGKRYGGTLNASVQKCKDSYVVRILCGPGFCMNNINDLGGLASPNAPEVPISNENDLSAQTISNALKQEELVAIRLKNGSWSSKISFPSPDSLKWKSIFIDHKAAQDSTLHVNNGTRKISNGQQIMYMSDGKTWKIMKTN